MSQEELKVPERLVSKPTLPRTAAALAWRCHGLRWVMAEVLPALGSLCPAGLGCSLQQAVGEESIASSEPGSPRRAPAVGPAL